MEWLDIMQIHCFFYIFSELNNLKIHCAYLFWASWDFRGQVNNKHHLTDGQVVKVFYVWTIQTQVYWIEFFIQCSA